MRTRLMLAVSLLGLWDSSYLWWAYTTPSRPMACLGGGCDVVRASAYSILWGFPLPVYGVLMYVTLALLISAQPILNAPLTRVIRYGIAAISGAGFLCSLYLSGIEAFVVRAWCTWCMISALSVTFVFAIALLELLRPLPHPEPPEVVALMRGHLAIAVAAVVMGAPAFYFLSRQEALAPTPTSAPETLAERLVRPDSHMTGNLQAPVTVVEFTDFECPMCTIAEEATQQMRSKYGDHVRFVFRQFPLERIHPKAFRAAEASECAAEQGKFWEYAEKLYGGDRDLSDAGLQRDARELGLDLKRFRQCLASGRMVERVRRDVEDGRALSVYATPTYFVGQQRVIGALRPSQFASLLAKELPKAGTPVAESQPLAARKETVSKPPVKQAPERPSLSTEPTLGSGGLLASGNLFTQFQDPATTCSEEETLKQQPTLIQTPKARELFENAPQALFVDVRQAREFETGRIPGAINLPVDEIEERWNSLPKDREIVLYESGRSPGDVCATSRTAGRLLLAHGFPSEKVQVYQDGLTGWEKAGLPVER